MATRRNGNGNLESAVSLLVNNQAALVAQHTAFLSHLTEDRQRFARIESDLDQIKALLLQHDRILKDLPEAIREKMGFKSRS